MSSIVLKPIHSISGAEKEALEAYLNKASATPYHSLDFANVVHDAFHYPNRSLVAFAEEGHVVGYLPQWKKGRALESVPWRDKGGPICSSDSVLRAFVEATKQLVATEGLKGFVWKDFTTPLLETYSHFIAIQIDLKGIDFDTYWKNLYPAERATVRSAERLGLTFRQVGSGEELADGIENFYRLLVLNRKRLGVPVYSIDVFRAYFRHFSREEIHLFEVRLQSELAASLVLFTRENMAIDAFSASDPRALAWKANDLMTVKVIQFCIERGIEKFDFGADSPYQTGLLAYKTKWLGKQARMGSKRAVHSSQFGDLKEGDHNAPFYSAVKYVIRKMPMWTFLPFSRAVVR